MSSLFQYLRAVSRSILFIILLQNYQQQQPYSNAFSIYPSTTHSYLNVRQNRNEKQHLTPSISTNNNIHSPSISISKSIPTTASQTSLHATRSKTKSQSSNENTLHKIPEEDDTCIPFIDPLTSTFIECYADSIAMVRGEEYTIGTPCDSPVALCYFLGGEDGDVDDVQLLPIELEDELMDEIFPIAAQIVEEEFGEDLSLERTPQTLTLIGDLGDEEDDDEEDEEDDEDDDNDDLASDDEEDVEILLTFEHDGREYNLVRLLDPVLLVGRTMEEEEEEDAVAEGNVNGKGKGKGKKKKNEPRQKCILLTPQESDKIMPTLEKMFFEQEQANDGISF